MCVCVCVWGGGGVIMPGIIPFSGILINNLMNEVGIIIKYI